MRRKGNVRSRSKRKCENEKEREIGKLERKRKARVRRKGTCENLKERKCKNEMEREKRE